MSALMKSTAQARWSTITSVMQDLKLSFLTGNTQQSTQPSQFPISNFQSSSRVISMLSNQNPMTRNLFPVLKAITCGEGARRI